jgi:hypothetical protein
MFGRYVIGGISGSVRYRRSCWIFVAGVRKCFSGRKLSRAEIFFRIYLVGAVQCSSLYFWTLL